MLIKDNGKHYFISNSRVKHEGDVITLEVDGMVRICNNFSNLCYNMVVCDTPLEVGVTCPVGKG